MANTVIIKPIITEKSLAQTKLNRYTFAVMPGATKSEIKVAVKTIFGVDAITVTTMRSASHSHRTGRRRLPTLVPALKKAIVGLKKGQTIKQFETTG